MSSVTCPLTWSPPGGVERTTPPPSAAAGTARRATASAPEAEDGTPVAALEGLAPAGTRPDDDD
jgi:hypothetical protein